MTEADLVVNLSCDAFVERARAEPRPILIPVVMTVPLAGRSPAECYRALRSRRDFSSSQWRATPSSRSSPSSERRRE